MHYGFPPMATVQHVPATTMARERSTVQQLLTVIFLLLSPQTCPGCQGQAFGDVRLVNDEANNNDERAGVPEIYLNGKWGTIQVYNTSSSAGAGQIVCRQLGANSGRMTSLSSISRSVSDDVPILLFITSCPRWNDDFRQAMSHILRCDYVLLPQTPPDPDRNHKNDLIVECQYWVKGSYDTQVRLVQGDTNYTSSGFVEVYLHDSWGPVCNLEQYEADTVCRQLGYTNAMGHGAFENMVLKPGSAMLDSFTCSSSSECLRDCFAYPPPDYQSNCSRYSWVNCTFDTAVSDSNTAGSSADCSKIRPPITTATTLHPSHLLLITSTVVGSCLVGLLTAAVTLLCCCCLPCCVLYKRRRRDKYDPLSKKSLNQSVNQQLR